MANIIPFSFRGALFEANHNFKASDLHYRIPINHGRAENATIRQSWGMFLKSRVMTIRR